MKRFLNIVIMCVLLTLSSAAAGTFEYILPAEFKKIEIVSYSDTDRLYVGYAEDGSCAAYNADGEKVSDDYEWLYFGSDGIGVGVNGMGSVGLRGTEYTIVNHNGEVIGTFGENFILRSGNYVFVDLGDNLDGRPMKYFQGEFAVCNLKGEQLKVLPYDKYVVKDTEPSFAGGLLFFEENGKVGAVNTTFEVVIEPIYDSLSYSGGEITAVKDGKYGIIDYSGNVLTGFDYDYIRLFSDIYGGIPCYKMKKDGKWGIISSDGTTVLMQPCEYDLEHSYVYTDYGLVRFTVENTREDKDEYRELYGLIDFYGNVVLPAEHIEICGISEGLIAAKKSYDHGGYYDLFGNEVSEFKYRMVSNCSEGYAFASSYIDGVWTHDVLDIHGNIAFTADGYSYRGFRNGVAYLDSHKFIDTEGNTVLADIRVSNGAYPTNYVKDGIYTYCGDGYGILKYTPEKEEPAWDYEYVDFYGEVSKIGLWNGGYVFDMKDGTTRYFTLDGKATENEVLIYGWNVFGYGDFVELRDNENNVMMVLKDGEYEAVKESDYEIAVIYDNSVLVLSKQPSCEGTSYDWTSVETSGLADFYIGNQGYYYKENNGKYYIIGSRTPYDDVMFLDGGFAAERDGGWYVVDADGRELNGEPLPLKPDVYEGCKDYYVVGSKILDKNFELVLDLGETEIQSIVSDSLIVVFGDSADEMGVVNIGGDTVIPIAKCDITYLGEKLFKVYRGGMYSVVNSAGRILAADCTDVTAMGENGYVGISQRGFEGFIDCTGKAVITLPHGYHVQGGFSGGLAPVVEDIVYGKYGTTSYIDESGRIVLASDDGAWKYGFDFHNSLALVGTNLGLAGAKGRRLVKCVYDTPSDWAAESVLKATMEGVLDKAQQKRYRKNITREDFCEIVYGLPLVQRALENVTIDGINFTDTANEKVKALSALGIIYGTGGDKFSPNSYVTRQEVATILDRLYRLGGGDITDEDRDAYADDGKIADWAKESVYNMRTAGIMQGMGDNKFSPYTLCTTEQTIVAAMRLYDM